VPVNEAFVLLNVDYKQQQSIIETAKKIPVVKEVKTVYGIYDVLIILESSDMQDIKTAIDVNLHKIEGINNITSLISVN
jgi:DNA-binding Lrp family transcriptional regulator